MDTKKENHRLIWRKENADKVRQYQKKFRESGTEQIKKWRDANPEKNAEYNKKWRTANPEKVKEINAKRRAKKIKATPAWSDNWLEKLCITELYIVAHTKSIITNIDYHVDHIVPLNSKIVQGFHCLSNLQILEGKINISKGNRTWLDMPDSEKR